MPVAVIGAGWAGCAAAVTLAKAGMPVTLYEAAATLGGRARRVERSGLVLDNGQHLLLGAYACSRALMQLVHDAAGTRPELTRRPLTMVPLSPTQQDALTLQGRVAPGRLGMFLGLLLARGLTFSERIANLAWLSRLQREQFARPPQETVAAMLAPLPPRVAKGLWEPLCIAAMNTPVAAASAQIFANVLAAAFAGPPDASDFLIPATDLSALFPDPAARYVQQHGGTVRTGVSARVVQSGHDGVMLAAGASAQPARAVVVAVGPHQLRSAFAPEMLAAQPALDAFLDQMQTLTYEPIVTIWLGYGAATRLPASIARLDDAPGQWVVDRPDIVARARSGKEAAQVAQVLAVIVSATGPHSELDAGALAHAADAQLRRLQPALPARVWSQVITEKRATYACTPRRVRPAGSRLTHGIYLAGDYVDADFPATLEAAARSGTLAAEALLADLGGGR